MDIGSTPKSINFLLHEPHSYNEYFTSYDVVLFFHMTTTAITLRRLTRRDVSRRVSLLRSLTFFFQNSLLAHNQLSLTHVDVKLIEVSVISVILTGGTA